jgi:subfamily B ATP-binding cassette protein MsbA
MKLINKLTKKTRFWTDNYLIIRELKYIPKIAAAAIIFTALAALFEGFSIGFLVSFLQSLTEPNARPIQTGVDWFDISILGINLPPTDRLYRIGGFILLITWIRVGLSYLSGAFKEIVQVKLVDRLRCQVFEQLQSFSLTYFSKSRSGELINTLTTEIERLRVAFGWIAGLFTVGLTALVYVVSLFWLSWQLTVVTVVLFALLTIGLSTSNKYIREFSFEVSKASGQFTSIAVEFINGIRTVHAFVTQDFERRRFYQASSAIVRECTKATLVESSVKPMADGLATTILVVLVVASFTASFSQETFHAASLLTFFFVLFRLVPLLQLMNATRASISTLAGSVDNVRQFLRTDDKPYFQDGTREFSQLTQAIDFVGVNFGYERDRFILHDISMTFEQGKMTALVGASGAGKTTIVDLIARFIDPTEGKICADSIDSREFKIDSLRRQMAIVSQDTFIFNTSVYQNIAYGSEGVSREQAIEAARLANALEFIQDLPEGFETILGDRGVRLSGGQRQRIAIARALLRNPEILILDEATSALDSVSEKLIQQSLEQLSTGRTVIAIAHRLSTIAQADKVVVLEQGRIVEQGRYQELLERRGKFWNYHQVQYNLNAAQ